MAGTVYGRENYAGAASASPHPNVLVLLIQKILPLILQQLVKSKSTVSSVADGVDSSNRKDDKSQSLSVTATVAGTTVTMVLVLAVGIFLGYYCRIRKRLVTSW